MSDSQRLQTDLIKVVDAGRRPDKSLAPRAPATAIPSAAGAARPKRPTAATAGGAAIASPLTEPDYTARTWHATRSITDTSGLFTIEYENVEEIVMEDANGAPNEVRLIFADEP